MATARNESPSSRATEWMERWRQHGGGLSLLVAGTQFVENRLLGEAIYFEARGIAADDPVALDLVNEACEDDTLYEAIERSVRAGSPQ